jgi:hypothetical protein
VIYFAQRKVKRTINNKKTNEDAQTTKNKNKQDWKKGTT